MNFLSTLVYVVIVVAAFHIGNWLGERQEAKKWVREFKRKEGKCVHCNKPKNNANIYWCDECFNRMINQ